MARRVGASYKYLQKLAGYFASPSLSLVTSMCKHYPELDVASFIKPKVKTLAKPGKAAPAKKAPAKKAAQAKKAPAKRAAVSRPKPRR
jgi:hypothetical protein